MKTTIKCKHCGHEIEITEALRQQIEEQVLSSERIKHQQELKEAKEQAAKVAKKEVRADFEIELQQQTDEAEEEKQRSKKFQEQLLESTKKLRQARQEKADAKLEMQKELAKEEERIRGDVRKRVEEEHRLKDSEKDKKLQDALKVNEELHRKLEQGSQQTQGEVLELELEDLLSSEFPIDETKPVPKGIRGGDVIQIVKDQRGKSCGTILWESKNAQWSKGWIEKLREDQRAVNAQTAILVSVNLPEDIKGFGWRDGVWVTNRESLISLAYAIRFNIIQVFHVRAVGVDKDEKMEVLYQYITSIAFKHRVEAIVGAFTNLQNDMETEKRWFNRKWARHEKEIRKVIDNTQGLYGSLQGITGRSLPQIEDHKFLPEGEDEEHQE